MEVTKNALPSVEQLLTEVPLYNHYQLDGSDQQLANLISVFSFRGRIDSFCPECEKLSTFEGYDNAPLLLGSSNYRDWTLADVIFRAPQLVELNSICNRTFHVALRCTRVNYHLMSVGFYINEEAVMEKIGQYPSLAQITLPELRKYQPVLTKEKYKELNRGIGLTTHGVGIGAFVYLRRVFEDLIEEAHKTEISEAHWDEELYQKSRFKERIQLLQHSLPSFLVENNALYSILSKGIHELSKKDCLDFFPAMKLSVELILDEKLERYEKKKKIEEAKASIAKIQAQLAKE